MTERFAHPTCTYSLGTHLSFIPLYLEGKANCNRGQFTSARYCAEVLCPVAVRCAASFLFGGSQRLEGPLGWGFV